MRKEVYELSWPVPVKGKSSHIKIHHHTTRRPANSPARLAFRRQSSKTTRKKGQDPTKTPTHDLPSDIAASAPQYHQKHAKNELSAAVRQTTESSLVTCFTPGESREGDGRKKRAGCKVPHCQKKDCHARPLIVLDKVFRARVEYTVHSLTKLSQVQSAPHRRHAAKSLRQQHPNNSEQNALLFCQSCAICRKKGHCSNFIFGAVNTLAF